MGVSEDQLKKKKQAGVSFTRLLLIAGVLGGVAGVLLARGRVDDRPVEEIAEEEVDKVMQQRSPPSSTSMAPDPRSLAGIPAYPGASPRKLTSRGTLQNTPAAISWFETEDPPERVLAFYAQAFEAEHRVALVQRFSPTMGYIGWMEDSTDGGPGLLHMVSVMKQYSQTMVLVSASRPEALLNNLVTLPGGIHLPPGATSPQLVNMGEGAFSNEVVYSRVSNMSGPELVTFFESQLKEQNFIVLKSPAGTEQLSVVGKKGQSSLVVGIRDEGEHRSVVLTYSQNSPEEPFQ